MIWIDDNLSSHVEQNRNKWQELMPDWEVRLWRGSDINENEFPEEILNKIRSANTNVQKSDIMKYNIIRKYGGVFVDMDVAPHSSLDQVIETGESVILCHYLPLTWHYISNVFFAAVPNHPIFERAYEMCCEATLNTYDIHMHSGPKLLGGAAFSAPYNDDDKFGLLDIEYIFRNTVGSKILNGGTRTEDFDKRFGTHYYGELW